MRGFKFLSVLAVWNVSSILAEDIPDDIFHCQNPKDVDKKDSIKCDKKSQEWKTDELDPDKPPKICGGDYEKTGQPDSIPEELEDLLEPCLLWSIFYGSLTTEAPTETTTGSPGSLTTEAPTPVPISKLSSAPTGVTDRPTTKAGGGGGGGFCKYRSLYSDNSINPTCIYLILVNFFFLICISRDNHGFSYTAC
jgi:hypothetical protein